MRGVRKGDGIKRTFSHTRVSPSRVESARTTVTPPDLVHLVVSSLFAWR